MTLIKSISGIRGTIGGLSGEGLTPPDIVKFTAAYAVWIKKQNPGKKSRIVIGRDARISGEMVEKIVTGTLCGMGVDVVNLGLATTPTVEIAVAENEANGGIIITASHNPKNWNALKLLNSKGEFVSAADGAEILEVAENEGFVFTDIDSFGFISHLDNQNQAHIDKILQLELVNTNAISKAGFRVVIDCVNSVGGLILPHLLRSLGISDIVELYCSPTGIFPHNPEPLPEHLEAISNEVIAKKADVGFVVDPDVDRLAIVCEDGSMFGEEYTLVSVADYVLQHTPGNTVSNLSSTKALKELTQKYGFEYAPAAVGEVNVVNKMKEINAVIGGEGNGGVIYPAVHYGRDALVGIALFLSQLADSGLKCSRLRKKYPTYVISKNKIELSPRTNVDKILDKIKKVFSNYPVNTEDGVKIEFDNGWVHLRKSNTEPIIRIYSEADDKVSADELAGKIINVVNNL